MPTQFRNDETATPRLTTSSVAGERLEAGLAADQVERKRLREKWERRHRWAVMGARMVRTVTWRLMWIIGTPVALAMTLCLFTNAPFSFALGAGAVLVALLFFGTALQGALEIVGEITVYAARRELVDLTKSD